MNERVQELLEKQKSGEYVLGYEEVYSNSEIFRGFEMFIGEIESVALPLNKNSVKINTFAILWVDEHLKAHFLNRGQRNIPIENVHDNVVEFKEIILEKIDSIIFEKQKNAKENFKKWLSSFYREILSDKV